ncbi:MAG: hypothetical protein JWQ62_2907, partial [Lacunisphaera sp.]|nr:hypothetical protein [Lacunisphaera sp.]
MFPAPKFAWCMLLCLGLAGPLAGRVAPAGEHLLTAAEIKALDGENAMWRLVHPAEDIGANLQRWRTAGFGGREIAALEPQLASMWEAPVDRPFGWLSPEAGAKIREVDAGYLVKLRAARLRTTTGVQAADTNGRTPGQVKAQWR